jgi:hypothetical protein
MPDQNGSTLVRGADGKLYLLSPNNPPQALTEEQTQAVENALQSLQGTLEGIVAQELSNVVAGCNQSVQIIIQQDLDLP